MTIGSLFSGIGGLELGLERAGLGPVRWQVEIDPYRRAVLAKHWPEAERFEDVAKVGRGSLAPVDLICGGFPCKDVSSAGKRAGLAGPQSGLWYQFARILDEMRPRVVVVENVASGAEKWVDAVRRDLEQLGYASLPIPIAASDLGAPHRRGRVFLLAYSDGTGLEEREQQPARKERQAAERSDLQAAPWTAEPELGRVAYGVPSRVDRIKALGDSVVPQCAQVVGEVICETILKSRAF